ncbi:MAG: M14 family metallopeptidase, partial [bacterium]
RDWFILAHPESQARVQAMLKWNPQLVVDSHEMGAYDTYFFNPPRAPINPNVSDHIKKWWKTFAEDQAKAFDRYGWSYYTRERFDEWYPGYGEAWPLFLGAIGILYEQASTDGTLVKRPDGTILPYREAVHHHFISSMANLTTAAQNRSALLRDFYLAKKNSMTEFRKGEPLTYYIVPGKNPSRSHRLLEKLIMQRIEVRVAESDFRVSNLHDYWHSKPGAKTLPKGTFLVYLGQPLGRLVKAILEFDPRMTSVFLEKERRELEKDKKTQVYDVTAWSVPVAYGVECYWSPTKPAVRSSLLKEVPKLSGKLKNPQPAFGFLFDYSDDRAVQALAKFLADGYKVRAAKEPFEIEGRSYSRGSLLIKLHENPKISNGYVQQVAETMGITIYGTNTALSTQGPDLGSNDFVLLQPPRIAIVTGPSISLTSFSPLWHLLDYRMKYRVAILGASRLNSFDLQKYNVLILPSTSRRPKAYRQILGKEGSKKIKKWVEQGGTLIGIGRGAAFLADTSNGLSGVRLRRQALKELDAYKKAVNLEQQINLTRIDSLAVWEGKRQSKEKTIVEKSTSQNLKELAQQDEHLRLFMPRGAILAVNLDQEHWLTFGAGKKVPAILYTSYAYWSKAPVQTPGRLADAANLRLSGLLWPEARERWENTAYVTREAKGRGQIILFAGEPNFRAYFHGTERLLLNALFLGPGFGTTQTVPW